MHTATAATPADPARAVVDRYDAYQHSLSYLMRVGWVGTQGFTFDSFEQVGAARASHTLSSILNGAGQLGGHSSPTTVVPYRIGSASTAAAARFAQAVAAAAGAALDSVAVVSVMSLRRRRLWGRRRQLSGAAGETVLYSVTTTADTAVSTGVASRMSDAQAFGAALGTHMSSLSGTFNATTFDVSAPEFATKFSCTLFAPLNGSSGVIDNIALQTALDNISADSWRSMKVKGTHDVYGVSATFAMNSAGMSYYQETPDESVPFLAITIFASLGCVACVLYTRHKEFCERISLWCTQPKLSLPSPPPSPAGKDQRDLSAWSNLSVSPSPRLRDGGSATAAGDPSFDALGDLATHLQAHESTPRLDLHPSFEEATDQHNGSSAGASVTLEAGPQHTTQITGTSALAAAGHSENAAVGRVLQSLQRRRDVTQALQQQLSRVRSNLDIMMTSTSQIASQPSTPPTTRP